MSIPKLTYFPLNARAELIRWVFHFKGIEFEDHILQDGQWAPLKASGFAEFGALPALDIDGLRLVQSLSIARYVAEKYDLFPQDLVGKYKANSILDVTEDIIRNRGMRYWKGEDKTEFEDYTRGPAIDFLAAIERRFVEDRGGEGFLNGQLDVSDLAIARLIYDGYLIPEYAEKFGRVLEERCPRLKALTLRVIDSSETLKRYLENRPFRPV